MRDDADRHHSHRLPWRFYVATSWTWVIGMMLPVLLIRDFGPMGWLVFAVPNVIGAASLGWWFKSTAMPRISPCGT